MISSRTVRRSSRRRLQGRQTRMLKSRYLESGYATRPSRTLPWTMACGASSPYFARRALRLSAGRDLPWRRTRDPYAVLVSEIMLQQTQVGRVLDYYPRFLARYPTVEDLAAATPSAVRETWEGLGYYRRAVNLRRSAQLVAERHG